jgi:SAM-dependent methyltransferase
MNPRRALPIVVLVCVVCSYGVAPSRVHGQPPTQGRPVSQQGTQAQKPYQPQVGQEGKDVVWVPTADTMVSQMLDMAKVGPGDYVIDLGSGDGRMVIAAARRGAQAHGVEFNANMVELARKNADVAGVTRLATFEQGDLFEADLSKATVVTMFLMDWINLRLRPPLLQLKPGTRVVSNTFSMAEWTPDARVQVTNQCVNYCTALLWIVPGKASGTWQLSPGRLTLTQTFQKVSGTLAAWGATRPVTGGRLRGNQLTFSVGSSQYDVRVTGNTMEGTVTTGAKSQAFRATKTTGK